MYCNGFLLFSVSAVLKLYVLRAECIFWHCSVVEYSNVTLKILLIQVILSSHLQDFCSPEAPFPPVNSSGAWLGSPPSPFILLPNSSILTWASNASYYTSWPPLSALRLLASLEGESCVKACQSAGLICEPALYRFINIKEAFSA